MVEKEGSRRQRMLLWIAAALPLLCYVGSIRLAEAQRRGAPQIEVKIVGYDPRDLFRGQYLQYRIATEGGGGAYRQQSQACAGPPAPRARQVFLHDGAQVPEECEMELPFDFVRAAHRFYIQQDRGRELEEAVREGRASVRLRAVNPRQALVEELLVDGEPVR